MQCTMATLCWQIALLLSTTVQIYSLTDLNNCNRILKLSHGGSDELKIPLPEDEECNSTVQWTVETDINKKLHISCDDRRNLASGGPCSSLMVSEDKNMLDANVKCAGQMKDIVTSGNTLSIKGTANGFLCIIKPFDSTPQSTTEINPQRDVRGLSRIKTLRNRQESTQSYRGHDLPTEFSNLLAVINKIFPVHDFENILANVESQLNIADNTMLHENTDSKIDTQISNKVQLYDENCDISTDYQKNRRIVGGKETIHHKSLAGIWKSSIRRIFCGATIVTMKHALTAAHCLYDVNKKSVKLLVGIHDVPHFAEETNFVPEKYIEYLKEIGKIIIHENYNPKLTHNDIAMIILSDNGAIKNFNERIGAACLPWHHKTTTFDDEHVTALGWGVTSDHGAKMSSVARRVELGIVPVINCVNAFGGGILGQTQMCSFSPGKDSCQGDSGGPLLFENFLLVGIVSYGNYCGKDTPGVNTRVGAYMNWIEPILQGKY